jgi:hypothetical protein
MQLPRCVHLNAMTYRNSDHPVPNECGALEFLRLTLSTLRQARQSGGRVGCTLVPPHVWPGNRIAYLRADLDAHRVPLGGAK